MSVTGWWRFGIAGAALTIAMTSAMTSTAGAASRPALSPGRPVTATARFMGEIDASRVPQEVFKQVVQRPRPMININGFSAQKMEQLRRVARLHAPAPGGLAPMLHPSRDLSIGKFITGMADSASICPYFGGCAPPDGAVAANHLYEMEGVNTSFALYKTNGALVPGWPKNSTTFFGIPNPSPAGCDPTGTGFTSDPRVFYDQNDKRWFVSILEVEGSPVGNACNPISLYWVAISKTSNPNGAYYVYALDMSLGSGNWADFTQTGYDGALFCFSGNMFSFGGGGFIEAEYFCGSKAKLENGQGFSYGGGICPSIGGICLDTVQPVKTLGSKASMPGVEYFASAENILFGGGVCSGGCSTWVLIDIIDAGGVGITALGTPTYVNPPLADQPSCSACIDTDDPRISGTPVYRDGSIWAGLNEGVNNGTTVVSGILWAQVFPTLDSTNHLSGAFILQTNNLFFGSDASVYYGGLAADDNNNMVMVWDYSSSVANPSTYAMSHKVGDPLGLQNCCFTLKAGATSTTNFRWGDFNGATSNEDPPDNLWVEGEYSTASGDWGTELGRVNP
jgi:hypothetical protein